MSLCIFFYPKMLWLLNLLIISVMWSVTSGHKCKLSNGKEGYCREKFDCFGLTENEGCPLGLTCCAGTGKAAEKCVEYGKYVRKEDYSFALKARIERHNTSECSVEAVSLIVGGEKAKSKEFPHMVAIGYGKDLKSVNWLCGGTLISENFVLSAAHCSKSNERGPANFARIGALNVQDPKEENFQDKRILLRINHPKYRFPSNYDDIALFKLQSPVTMNAFVRPACLHLTPNEFDIKKATATGWGKMKFSDTVGSPELMKVVLSFFDYQKCNRTYEADIGGRYLAKGIIRKQICAGDKKGGHDTCQGDSGGPIQIVLKEPHCMYSVIGVTSFGKFCGFKNSPAVYSRVSYYVPWIESIVWP